jgi:hypothetical protein
MGLMAAVAPVQGPQLSRAQSLATSTSSCWPLSSRQHSALAAPAACRRAVCPGDAPALNAVSAAVDPQEVSQEDLQCVKGKDVHYKA